MIEDGALEDPKVDVIVGLHTGCIWDEGINNGEVAVRYGSTLACMDRFEITVKGKGSHGAYPHGSIDPISIGSQIVTELQTIVSREMDPLEPGVVTIGEFHAGTAFNIIPGECRLLGTVRALNQKNREFIAKRIEEIAAKVAEGLRGSIEFKYGWEGRSRGLPWGERILHFSSKKFQEHSSFFQGVTGIKVRYILTITRNSTLMRMSSG
jgi:amidohydrolase